MLSASRAITTGKLFAFTTQMTISWLTTYCREGVAEEEEGEEEEEEEGAGEAGAEAPLVSIPHPPSYRLICLPRVFAAIDVIV